jgi:hypothetical protein
VEQSSTRVLLKDITALTVGGTELIAHGFGVTTGADNRQVFMGCEVESEMNEWLLLIEAACRFAGSLGVLSYSMQVKLFGETLKNFTGGIVKRDEIDEEWQYRKSGALILQNKATAMAYQWDGMSLIPTTKGRNWGKGTFDGLLLKWYGPLGQPLGFDKKKKKKRSHKKGSRSVSASPAPIHKEETPAASGEEPQFEEEPSMAFLWNANEKTYYFMEGGEVCKEDYRNWKWSRHFLTKIVGIGHWINEGSVPEQVCMLVQLMRYQRMGFPKPKKDEEEKEEEDK